jgi:hypothetical protein
MGNVFKLTPAGGSWTYTDLHDFAGGNDGITPLGRTDCRRADGTLYGTTYYGRYRQRMSRRLRRRVGDNSVNPEQVSSTGVTSPLHK